MMVKIDSDTEIGKFDKCISFRQGFTADRRNE